jgi:hypothetical protein
MTEPDAENDRFERRLKGLSGQLVDGKERDALLLAIHDGTGQFCAPYCHQIIFNV